MPAGRSHVDPSRAVAPPKVGAGQGDVDGVMSRMFADELALDGGDEPGLLDVPLTFTWPLAGPFGAVLLSAMAWLSVV